MKVIDHYVNYGITRPWVIMDQNGNVHIFYRKDHFGERPRALVGKNSVKMIEAMRARGGVWEQKLQWRGSEGPPTIWQEQRDDGCLGVYISEKWITFVYDLMNLPGLMAGGGKFIRRWVPNEKET